MDKSASGKSGERTTEKQQVEQFQKQVEQLKKNILMFLLNIMFPGFILVVAYICIYSFLWSNNIPLYRYIHLYIDGCFYLLTVLNYATMNICAYVFLCGHRFSFLLVIYRGVELLVILL